jgi:hypothetical protein
MKTNRAKLFGIIALVAIIGVTFAACNKGGSSSGGRVPSNPESDFEVAPIDGGKSVQITKYVGDKWEVGIPSKIRNLPVTHIGSSAFSGKNLIKVTIPNSVITIGDYTFPNNQLTSVTTIGDGAFQSNQLTSVTIPDSVTNILGGAFGHNQLTSVTIGANVDVRDAFIGYDRDFFMVSIGFKEVYDRNGKAAGTYTRPNTGSTTWTKQ